MNYQRLTPDQIRTLMEDSSSSSPKTPFVRQRKLAAIVCRQYLDLLDEVEEMKLQQIVDDGR